MPKKESSVIPVRLSEEVLSRIDSVAAMIGTTRTALIRLCADTFAGHIAKGGKAALPLDWRDILEKHDGRTKKARDIAFPGIERLACNLNEEPTKEPTPAPKKQKSKSKRKTKP